MKPGDREVFVAIGKRLRLMRERQELTLREFGVKYGIQYSTLQRLEKGHTPDGLTALRALRILNESPAEELAKRLEFEVSEMRFAIKALRELQ